MRRRCCGGALETWADHRSALPVPGNIFSGRWERCVPSCPSFSLFSIGVAALRTRRDPRKALINTHLMSVLLRCGPSAGMICGGQGQLQVKYRRAHIRSLLSISLACHSADLPPRRPLSWPLSLPTTISLYALRRASLPHSSACAATIVHTPHFGSWQRSLPRLQ